MPVAPVTSTVPSPVLDASAQPVAGFEAVLAAQLPAAGSLPSVPLSVMVDAVASGPALPQGPTEGVASAGASDGWGVASTRAASTASVGSAAGGAAAAANGPGAAVIEAGERYLGVPYKWGGTSAATGFDCSGFVQQVYADLGVSLPRVSVDQSRAGSPVASLDQARPGDLIFWRASGGRPNHIGIYAGNGQMLVAPRTGDVVRYQDISRTPDAIRRVIT